MELRRVEVWSPPRNLFTDKGNIEVPGKYIPGFFHCWEHYKDGEDYSRIYAIVELEDGKVFKYEVNEIRFIDRDNENGNSNQ